MTPDLAKMRAIAFAAAILFPITASAQIIEAVSDWSSYWCRSEYSLGEIADAVVLDRSAGARKLDELKRIGMCGFIPKGNRVRFDLRRLQREINIPMTFAGSPGAVYVSTNPGLGPFTKDLRVRLVLQDVH